MTVFLTEVSRNIIQAYGYYGIRILEFAIVAAIGIFCGILIRKKKDSKNEENN